MTPPGELCGRLGRLALETDRCVDEILDCGLEWGDDLTLTPAIAHLELVVERLRETVYELEMFGKLRQPEAVAA